MQNRIALAKENNVDMVLSIHMNEYRARSESGPQVFYREGSNTGRLLAGCMQEALVSRLAPKKVRTALPGDYFILQLEAPSVLIECGFLSNPAEEQKLLTSEYQALLGEAIAQGAAEYWRIRPQ
jgi:N-acetylmuramoyl-L-alanine amidase